MTKPWQAKSEENAPRPQRRWGRILLLPGLIAMGIAAIFIFHLDRFISFDALAENRAWLLRQVADHLILTLLVFSAAYVVATALSLPGASVFTMTAGFLFGFVLGTIVALIAATAGAVLLFAVARTSFGEMLQSRTQGRLDNLREGFRKDAFSYLLFLRLVPVFPFWLVNLVAAFLKVPFRTFLIATLVGILPGDAVYASVGSGLGGILDRGQKPDLGMIFAPEILIPILALAVLSLVPIAYRRWRRPPEIKP